MRFSRRSVIAGMAGLGFAEVALAKPGRDAEQMLLHSAEIDDGDTPVYTMESVSTDLTTPADEYFTVPT